MICSARASPPGPPGTEPPRPRHERVEDPRGVTGRAPKRYSVLMSRSSPLRLEHDYPRGGLHGQIVHAIGRQILRGEIQPGEVLPLTSGLPASRTVLREAIKVLAAK